MDLGQKLINCVKYDDSYKYIKDMDEQGELEQLLPVIKDMKNVGECKYHVVNCFDHSLLAVETFEEMMKDNNFLDSNIVCEVKTTLDTVLDDGLTKRELLKLGILFHDMGKPEAKTIDDTGRVRFRKHEKLGADMIFSIGKNIGLSENNIIILYKYIRNHMSLLELYKDNDMSQEKLYKIFNCLKNESIDVLLLGYADIVSTKKLLNLNEDMNIIKIYMIYAINNYIYFYKESK